MINIDSQGRKGFLSNVTDPSEYHMSPLPPSNGQVNEAVIVIGVIIAVLVVVFIVVLFLRSHKDGKSEDWGPEI